MDIDFDIAAGDEFFKWHRRVLKREVGLAGVYTAGPLWPGILQQIINY